jgi:ectoine hydroxylase-related dioxygenase (phytanoyl-CoA dioxygenase family)
VDNGKEFAEHVAWIESLDVAIRSNYFSIVVGSRTRAPRRAVQGFAFVFGPITFLTLHFERTMGTSLTRETVEAFAETQVLGPDDLKTLVQSFKQDGYVLLENCLNEDLLIELRKSFSELMNAKVARTGIKPVQVTDTRNTGNERVKIDFDPQGGNHDLNRWNMHLPSTSIFMREEIVAHPRVTPILDELIGADQALFIIASDTPYPGSGYQNIHQDFPRFGLTINIPLVDFTEENAPLEIWPGTHVRDTDKLGAAAFHTGHVNLSANELDEMRGRIPGKRMLIKAGSILIRDQRLVHRGTANVSDQSRPCLSLWYKGNAGAMRPLELNIPIPHRFLADKVAWIAFQMREAGRKHVDNRQNKALVNLGSLLGRLVEEFSASDRDYRRVIPAALFDSLPTRARHLLRFSRTNHAPGAKGGISRGRSLIGSIILTIVASGFVLLGLGAYCFGSRGGSAKNSYSQDSKAKTTK